MDDVRLDVGCAVVECATICGNETDGADGSATYVDTAGEDVRDPRSAFGAPREGDEPWLRKLAEGCEDNNRECIRGRDVRGDECGGGR